MHLRRTLISQWVWSCRQCCTLRCDQGQIKLTLIGFLAFPYQKTVVVENAISLLIDLKGVKEHHRFDVLIRTTAEIPIEIHFFIFVILLETLMLATFDNSVRFIKKIYHNNFIAENWLRCVAIWVKLNTAPAKTWIFYLNYFLAFFYINFFLCCDCSHLSTKVLHIYFRKCTQLHGYA